MDQSVFHGRHCAMCHRESEASRLKHLEPKSHLPLPIKRNMNLGRNEGDGKCISITPLFTNRQGLFDERTLLVRRDLRSSNSLSRACSPSLQRLRWPIDRNLLIQGFFIGASVRPGLRGCRPCGRSLDPSTSPQQDTHRFSAKNGYPEKRISPFNRIRTQ